jgi:hypothetical protein
MPTKIPGAGVRAYPCDVPDVGLLWLDTRHFALNDPLDGMTTLAAHFIACDLH